MATKKIFDFQKIIFVFSFVSLDISYQVVRTALSKNRGANFTQIIEQDQRGRQKNRPLEYPND